MGKRMKDRILVRPYYFGGGVVSLEVWNMGPADVFTGVWEPVCEIAAPKTQREMIRALARLRRLGVVLVQNRYGQRWEGRVVGAQAGSTMRVQYSAGQSRRAFEVDHSPMPRFEYVMVETAPGKPADEVCFL